LTEDDAITKFVDLFYGTSWDILKVTYVHLDVDTDVAPVQIPLHRLPVALRDRVKAELRQMIKDDVITSMLYAYAVGVSAATKATKRHPDLL